MTIIFFCWMVHSAETAPDFQLLLPHFKFDLPHSSGGIYCLSYSGIRIYVRRTYLGYFLLGLRPGHCGSHRPSAVASWTADGVLVSRRIMVTNNVTIVTITLPVNYKKVPVI
jgi:hypothetical protein